MLAAVGNAGRGDARCSRAVKSSCCSCRVPVAWQRFTQGGHVTAAGQCHSAAVTGPGRPACHLTHLHDCWVVPVLGDVAQVAAHILDGCVHRGVVEGAAGVRAGQQPAQRSLHLGAQLRLGAAERQRRNHTVHSDAAVASRAECRAGRGTAVQEKILQTIQPASWYQASTVA
jgi:hypothetical protein